MILRTWVAVAVLAVSWLAGLGYYAPASVWSWAGLVLLGAGLLLGQKLPLPEPRSGTIALVLLLPVIWFVPWPQKVAVVLLAVGLALAVAPIPQAWPRRLAAAGITAGGVLLMQSAAMYVYAALTARSHDLPGPLATALGALARLLGVEVATTGSTVAMEVATTVHPLGATWDLVLPPTVVCFLVGGAVLIGFSRTAVAPGQRPKAPWLRGSSVLLLVVLGWLPIRLVLLLGLYAQRVALADSSLPLCVMEQFLTWWLPVLLLAGPVLLSWWFVSTAAASGAKQSASEATAALTTGRRAAVVVLAALGAAMLTFLWAWDPIGSPTKQGCVRVVERCSGWEPTDVPYDENSYGEKASYTYRLIYDYASHYFTMSRLERSTPIDAESLAACDVLVLKTPTERLSKGEVDAIVRFVEHGGGLLMIGDHTNVFRSTTYLNDVARRLGFTFRNDLLFRVGDAYEQPFPVATVPHPAVMHVDRMDLAVSCSIDPGLSWGRAATLGSGLWSLPPQYEHSNYHPPAEYRPQMRVGPFVQLWAARFGKGRVLAFTDSTIFSNFCIFQPGKAELMLNMLSWLNHRSPLDERLTWLALVVPVGLVGLVLVMVAVLLARKARCGWLLVLAAGLFGAVACSAAVTALARVAMPPPQLKRPLLRFVIDREVSEVPLSKGAYIQGDGEGYGLLEQWIPRVDRPGDYRELSSERSPFTARRKGEDVFSGDVLVVICPTRSISRAYRDRAVEFVRGGGRLLVLDAPSNYGSTANGLLWPFGLSVETERVERGPLSLSSGPSGIELDEARAVRGGTPIAEVNRVPVAAQVQVGQGTVTAVGFASAFNDAAMGREWLLEPDAALARRYGVLFALLRSVVQGGPASKEATPPVNRGAYGPSGRFR